MVLILIKIMRYYNSLSNHLNKLTILKTKFIQTNFMQLIKFFFYFFLSRKFYLINTAYEYMTMVEYFNSKNQDLSEFTITVGFCSPSSKKQIKNLIKEFYKTKQKIFYLDEMFNIKIFHVIFFVSKIVKRKFLLSVGGQYNYYLFKEFFKKSSKVVFIDDGYECLVTIKKKEIQDWDCEFYTSYNIKNSKYKIKKNNFDFIRSFRTKSNIDKELVILMGTAIYQDEIRFKNNNFNKHLNKFIEVNKNKKILYFPHRNEIIDNNNPIFKNFEICRIGEPIETYLLKSSVLPGLIAGFYTAALYSLKIILNDEKITVMNINFDNDGEKWSALDRPFMHEYFVEHMKEVNIKSLY